MKIITLITAILLFACAINAQDKLPIIKATSDKVSIQDGDNLSKDSWTLAPAAKPDVYETTLTKGKTKKVTFITDLDKISFDVEVGKKYDFIIQNGNNLCYTQIAVKELNFWSDPKFWETGALKTPYKPNISDDEKIAGLSKFWSEAKYNFINFPSVPALDWDKTYLEFIPKVLATKSTLEYYKVLTAFCAKLKDGHTNIYEPDELDDELYGRPAIATRLIEDKVIITRIFDEKLKAEGIQIGQEVLEIDNIPVKKYAEEMVLPYASESTPQSYDVRVYQRNLLNGSTAKPVNLTVKAINSKIFKIDLPRLSRSDISKLVPARKPFEIKMLDGNIAHIMVNSMDDGDKVDELFAAKYNEIEKADAIILDLRENGGGSSGIGYNILAFLTDKPFNGSKWFTRNYRPTYRAWGNPQEKFGDEASSISAEQLKAIRKGAKVYDKPVIVLSSPRTFSAAEDFLVAYKPLKRGLIIGEPSGGSTGQPMLISLPGGGQARICTKRDAFADGTEFVGVGVVPDILASPKISDFVEGKDAVLEVALKELKKNSK
jgi:carboxyl-terminal processing protease